MTDTSSRTVDAAAFRESQREEWKAAAPGWRRWFDAIEAPEAGQAMTAKLIELSGIGPGDTVLDVAAGYGEPGLTAAEVVGPRGHVVCTDISEDMLTIGRQRAAQAGLDNVEFVCSDAEALTFPEGSFDAVLSRWGLMFVTDLARLLERLHTFLKPHGRVAAMVWGRPEDVQMAVSVPVIRKELDLPPPPPGPGMFALADADRLAALFGGAGFRDVETGTTRMVFEGESPERFTECMRDVSAPITALLEGRPAEVQERVWGKVTEAYAAFTTPEGRVRTENQAVWVAASK